MINYVSGNLLDDDADALVNTVNCVGVMGKGIALAFKKKFPANYTAYKAACAAGNVSPGSLFSFREISGLYDLPSQHILNVATKKHWRQPSKLEYVEDGIAKIADYLSKGEVRSIAIPPLGCGNGGLDWDVVGPKLVDALVKFQDIDIRLYAPQVTHSSSETAGPALSMTNARALLFLSLGSLEKYFDGAITRISAQKLFYFAQKIHGVEWVPFRKGNFGPYSSELASAFKKMNKTDCLSGYYKNSGEIEIHPKIFAEASEHAQDDKVIETTLDRLSKLIEGFESPYGMELLGTTHFISQMDNTHDPHRIYQGFQSWDSRKAKMFDESAVSQAIERLGTDGLLEEFSLQ